MKFSQKQTTKKYFLEGFNKIKGKKLVLGVPKRVPQLKGSKIKGVQNLRDVRYSSSHSCNRAYRPCYMLFHIFVSSSFLILFSRVQNMTVTFPLHILVVVEHATGKTLNLLL